ncbi:hypothetical protein BLOT_013408, partial [Blomia tropicalis]
MAIMYDPKMFDAPNTLKVKYTNNECGAELFGPIHFTLDPHTNIRQFGPNDEHINVNSFTIMDVARLFMDSRSSEYNMITRKEEEKHFCSQSLKNIMVLVMVVGTIEGQQWIDSNDHDSCIIFSNVKKNRQIYGKATNHWALMVDCHFVMDIGPHTDSCDTLIEQD